MRAEKGKFVDKNRTRALASRVARRVRWSILILNILYLNVLFRIIMLGIRSPLYLFDAKVKTPMLSYFQNLKICHKYVSIT